VKIGYISDLHIDFWVKCSNTQSPKTQKKIKKFVKDLTNSEVGDVLLIGGDIGHYNEQNILLLKEFKEYFKEVLLVTGNHDMYLVSENQSLKYSRNSFLRLHEFKEMCEENGIRYLNGDVFEHGGIRIGGTPMWYAIKDGFSEELWKNESNDSNYIQEGPVVTVNLAYGGTMKICSFNSETYYNNELQKLQNMKDIDIFLCHVIPTIMEDQYRHPDLVHDELNFLYETDNIKLLKETGAKYCIFGHMHHGTEFVQEGISFKSNPLGYPGENKGSKPKIKFISI
jgi:DNA repair exonuclease SbcCD nuclease subunit